MSTDTTKPLDGPAEPLAKPHLQVGPSQLLVAQGLGWAPRRGSNREWLDPLPPRSSVELRAVAKVYDRGRRVRGYQATIWDAGPTPPIECIDDLAKVLQFLSIKTQVIIVFGQFTADGLLHAETMPRTHTGYTVFAEELGIAPIGPTLEDRDGLFLPLDVDSWILPSEDLSPEDRAEDLAARIRARTPYFADADMVITMSASYGFVNGVHKAHAFLLLDAGRTVAQIKERLRQDRFFDGKEVFDSSLYTPSQPLYASGPVLIDCADPLPNGRVFVCRGGRERVSLPLPEAAKISTRRTARSGARRSASRGQRRVRRHFDPTEPNEPAPPQAVFLSWLRAISLPPATPHLSAHAAAYRRLLEGHTDCVPKGTGHAFWLRLTRLVGDAWPDCAAEALAALLVPGLEARQRLLGDERSVEELSDMIHTWRAKRVAQSGGDND